MVQEVPYKLKKGDGKVILRYIYFLGSLEKIQKSLKTVKK